MTGVGGVDLVLVVVFLIPLTRHFVSTSPARGEVDGLLRFARNDDRARGEVTRLLRCARNDDRVIGEIDRLLRGACNDDRARGEVV